MGNCPKCGAPETQWAEPGTLYACGSSDYDQRPGTFKQSDKCKRIIEKNVLNKGL